MRHSRVVKIAVRIIFVLAFLPASCAGQEANRTKIAQGEYAVSTDDDLGVGPADTEVFHFRESWVLWRTAAGEYEVEGERTFESPRGQPHENRFWAKLSRDLRPLAVKEFARLRWRRDSGPLSCDLLPTEMLCNSGGKQPDRAIHLQIQLREPYGILWPISVFSLGSLAYVAAEHEDEAVSVDLVRINEFSESLPVLTIKSQGSIRFMGKSDKSFEVSGRAWHPRVFELVSSATRTVHLWTSPEGLVLAIEQANWPKTTLRLVSFRQFGEFPRAE